VYRIIGIMVCCMGEMREILGRKEEQEEE